MSELGKIKPLIQPIPVRPVNKDPANKKQGQKKKGKTLPQKESESSKEHVDEFI